MELHRSRRGPGGPQSNSRREVRRVFCPTMGGPAKNILDPKLQDEQGLTSSYSIARRLITESTGKALIARVPECPNLPILSRWSPTG